MDQLWSYEPWYNVMVHKNVFKIQWGLGLWCLTPLSTIFHKIQRDNLKQQNKQVNDTGQCQPGLFHPLIIKITFDVLSRCDIAGILLKLALNTNQSINHLMFYQSIYSKCIWSWFWKHWNHDKWRNYTM